MLSPELARRPGLVLLLLSSSLLVGGVRAEDPGHWPRFRGPNGSGGTEQFFPAEWGKAETAWRIDLPGMGHSSPVIWGERAFLTAADEKRGELVILAVSLADGSEVWRKTVGFSKTKHHKFNHAASSTPAVDSEGLYFCLGTKERLVVRALRHDGTERWERDLGGVSGGHGFGASPIVHGDLLILNNDQEGATSGSLVALNRADGSIAWETERKAKRLSYSTPCAHEGVLVFTNWTHGFSAVDPATGVPKAEYSAFDQESKERAISSPITHGDLVVGTCGFTNNPKHCVAMRLGEDGWEEVWRIEKSVPHIPSVIAYKDRVYLWGDNGIVTCVVAGTGEEIWRERVGGATFYSSPVRAGNLLFNIDQAGIATAIRTGDTFEIVGQTDLDDLCQATPAFGKDRMLVRTATTLRAIRAIRR